MNQPQTAITSPDHFSASVTVHGAQVHIGASTLDALLKTLTQFGHPVPNLDAAVSKVIEKIAEVTKDKPEAKAKKEAAAQVEKPAATATDAATSTTSQTSGSASVQDDTAPRPTYDDVKRAVLGMAKISPEKAKATLAKFTGQNGEPCDHGTKLKLEDYAAFLAAAEEVLA